ncbi:MAG TPA: hypothetical protein VK528_07015 [Flavobacterium sp.]|nr:hypothetical protein [Flavobacterium sp.]
MRNTLTIGLLLLSGCVGFAQQTNGIGHVTLLKKNGAAKATQSDGIGHVTLLKRNAMLVYLGGGYESPGSPVKDGVSLGNMGGINLEIYKPLWLGSNVSLGISAGGQYMAGNKDPLETIPSPFHISGETSTNVTARGTGSPKQAGFKAGAGPQLSVHLGNHFVISPILQAGYLSITQKEFGAEQTTDFNSTVYNYDLLKQTETKTSGLAIIPKIRLQYFLSGRIGLWIEGNYTSGPTIKNTISTFSPQGQADQDGNYNIDQMLSGSVSTSIKETKYNALGLNAGIVIAIGGTSNYTGHVTLLKKNGKAIATENTDQDKPKTAIGYSRVTWGEHGVRTIPNCFCRNGGLFCGCINGPGYTDESSASSMIVSTDETVIKTEAELVGNDGIRVINTVVSGEISNETMQLFTEKKAETFEEIIPAETMNAILKKLNLTDVTADLSIPPAQQKYLIISTTDTGGNPMNQLVVHQYGNILVSGVKKTIEIITVSKASQTADYVGHVTLLR